eukprot:scaffold39365_cov45-Prasinocladus_malaysianus.AAC.1
MDVMMAGLTGPARDVRLSLPSQKSAAMNRLPSALNRFEDASLRGGRSSYIALAQDIACRMQAQLSSQRENSKSSQPHRQDSGTPISVSIPRHDSASSRDFATSFMYGNPAERLAAGLLAPLLNYVPSFVRERCVSGQHLDMLAEHRHVSVLFFIGQPKVIPE